MSDQQKQHIGIYPASFDPITTAHVSIAERAARNLDKLYVAVAAHPTKNGLFTASERLNMVQNSIQHIANAEAVLFDKGVTVDNARELGATLIIRGTRGVTDLLDEINLFEQNLHVQQAIDIHPGNEVFIDTATYYALPGQDHISSTLVRALLTTPGVKHRKERIEPLVSRSIIDTVMTKAQ